MSPKEYDVFLSHNSADKVAVDELARRLKAKGLISFFDDWALIPGQLTQPALAEALAKSKTCAVFLGPNDLGPWHKEEIQVAIDIRARNPDFRVIPVLLPGANRPRRGDVAHLEFLINAPWVEFLQTLDDPRQFHKLVCGIRGIPPEEGESIERLPVSKSCPYRGLEGFRPEDEKFFFGRENLTGWLVSHVRREVHAKRGVRFLGVLGPSGSGKSSVVLAGLVPAVKNGAIEGSKEWLIAILRPGDDPLKSLANAVTVTTSDTGLDTGILAAKAAEFKKQLNEDQRYLDLFASMLHQSTLSERRLLIVVDQFEEVFTYRPDGEDDRKQFDKGREMFLGNLLHAASTAEGRVAVVLTIRSDFFGACTAFPRLAALLSSHQHLVCPMTDAELRDAIERPAFMAGCELESGLTELLLSETRGHGALPLLQFTLMALWGHRDVRKMTIAAYKQIGGVAGALETHASNIYKTFSEAEQELCRRIFLRLTQPGKGTEDTKRRVRWQTLTSGTKANQAVAVLTRLTEERLIITAGTIKTADGNLALGDDAYVEVAHEALIKAWKQLRDWLDADRAGLELHSRLSTDAELWEKSHADPSQRDSTLLYSGPRLSDARAWSEKNVAEMNPLEREFLKASSTQADESIREVQRHLHERLEQADRLTRETRARLDAEQVAAGRFRVLVKTVTGLLATGFLIIALGAYFWFDGENRLRAEGLVNRLESAEIGDVPAIVRDIAEYRLWANAMLRERFKSATAEPRTKLNMALALVPVDPTAIPHLRDRLLTSTPSQFPIVRDALMKHDSQHQQQIENLWKIAKNASASIADRFQTACALATYTPEDPRWPDVAATVAQHLVGLPDAEMVAWRDALRPARKNLQTPLVEIFAASAEETQIRQFAVGTLIDFANDNGKLLAEATLEADPKTFERLLVALQESSTAAIARFEQELNAKLEPKWNDPPLDPGWKPLDKAAEEKIRNADGLIDERFALCLSLPVAQLVELCEAMRPSGYRPTSIVMRREDAQVAAAVWTRDGCDWKLAGPIDAQAAVELDELQRPSGLRPILVMSIPPTGRQMYILWGPSASTLQNPTTGGGENTRVELASAPSSMPMTWNVKFFRCEPAANPPSPADWDAAVAGEPFFKRDFPVLNINVPTQQAAQLQNVLLEARGTLALEEGPYLLWALADDGMRVFFDNKLVIDRWTENDRQPIVMTIPVNAGKHDLRVEHFQLIDALALEVRIGYAQVQLVSSTAEPGVTTPSPGLLYESSTAGGADPAIVVNELAKLRDLGFRPLTVKSVGSQPGGQPATIDVFCRRPTAPEDVRDSLARRQSRAGVALARLGLASRVWPRLAFTPDPRLRTELIHDLADFATESDVVLDRLDSEQDLSTRRALLLALGQFQPNQLAADRRSALIRKLVLDYENEPDGGLHGAIEWLLRKWDHGDDVHRTIEQLKPVDKAPQGCRAVGDRQWYINALGQTFMVLPAGEFLMGSPESEPKRNADETPHRRLIERPFAIAATEVTREQYLPFVNAKGARDPSDRYVTTLDSPQSGIDWFEAARYCNWLSEQDGIDADQWCFVPNDQGKFGPGMKIRNGYMNLVGYRFAAEAEWEYACRSDTATSRYFGNSEARLPAYSWCNTNSDMRSRPAHDKKPNDSGMFGMLGNAAEWCYDAAFLYPASQGTVPTLTITSMNLEPSFVRVLRGGSFAHRPADIRSGFRAASQPGYGGDHFGFRPARTYR